VKELEKSSTAITTALVSSFPISKLLDLTHFADKATGPIVAAQANAKANDVNATDKAGKKNLADTSFEVISSR
jgi:hypothetical protein